MGARPKKERVDREERWRRQDEALERYWRTPWLRYRGNLWDGNHRTRLPTLGEQERGGNAWERDP